jgi:hypothetical protein
MFLVSNQRLITKDIYPLDYTLSLFGHDSCSRRRELAFGLNVTLSLVSKTAKQTTTVTRDFGWIEGKVLVPGMLSGDRIKLLNMPATALLAATDTVAADPPGFIPYTYLA